MGGQVCRVSVTVLYVNMCTFSVTVFLFWIFILTQCRGHHNTEVSQSGGVARSTWNNVIASIPIYLHLTEGSPSKYSPWVAMHLAQWCYHFWKHFWNCCCGIAFSAVITIFCNVFNILKSSSLLRQTLFLETVRSHSEPNQGNRMGVSFQ
jgi:hypothetical protein